MNKPITIDLPHRLGAEEARRRMQSSIGKLQDHIPGGADVSSRWDGDRMHLDIGAMGQQVNAQIDVQERKVTVSVQLPLFLSMFAGKIEALLRRGGSELLEDKTPGKKG